MKETITFCDMSGCKAKASHFTFFKDRKADGAGGMENWNYAFDICESDQRILLQRLLTTFERSHEITLVKILEEVGIKWREE